MIIVYVIMGVMTKENNEKKEVSGKNVKPKALIAPLLIILLATVFAVIYWYINNNNNNMSDNQNISDNIKLEPLDQNLKELKIRYIKQGNGRVVKKGDIVYVVYAGFLPSGQVFDSNVNTGQATGFPIGEGAVIKGWDEALPGVKEGSELIIDIPADKAYGEKGMPGRIPANSPLRFDVFVVKVMSKEEAQKAAQKMQEQNSNSKPETAE